MRVQHRPYARPHSFNKSETKPKQKFVSIQPTADKIVLFQLLGHLYDRSRIKSNTGFLSMNIPKKNHHHHHLQPKPPAVAIVHQNGLSCTSCRASMWHPLVNPGGGWTTTGTSPFLWWPLAISCLGWKNRSNTTDGNDIMIGRLDL